MLVSTLTAIALTGILAFLYRRYGRDLPSSPYPSPEAARLEMDDLIFRYPARVDSEIIGSSTEGRPLVAYRIHADGRDDTASRPRLLITSHLHAVEFIGSYVARGIARRLVEGYGEDREITTLLDRADVWVVPLLNPDGAARVWKRAGWSGLGWSRFTANGVDPNRNFPALPLAGRGGWNAASGRPGSAYYRGPQPLSEPECMALAQLCLAQRFCGAINFHSFGGVVFLPALQGDDREKAKRAFAVFQGPFQSRQRACRYRPVAERSARITGQLDPFLLDAFGTPSVTVEVSRPGWQLLLPWRTFNVFWWANPASPSRWLDNDRDAAVHALACLLDATEGTPCAAKAPQLADRAQAHGDTFNGA